MKYTFILFSLLVLPCSGQEGLEAPHVSVHEWGVITWEGGSVYAQGAPWDYWEEVVTRAPVVYFHGPDFSGDFTVSVDNGYIIEIYPSDGTWSDDSHTWSGSFFNSYDETRREIMESRGMLYPSDFAWALEHWREPEALTFEGSDGFTEEFLYYETHMDDVTFMPLYPGWNPEEVTDREYLDTELVLLTFDDDGLLTAATCTLARFAMRSGLPLEWDLEVDCSGNGMLEVFYEWSRDLIDISEVDALWLTWRDWFTYDALTMLDGSGADALAVYLLPQELTGSVSTLELTVSEGYTVNYGRYLLVAVPVTL
jgi:hypothetical protein